MGNGNHFVQCLNNEYELGNLRYDLAISNDFKNLFSIVVLDSAQNNDAGILTASDLPHLVTSNNRTYMNHTNTGNNQTSWNFQ